jgi:bifunctional polynucleotide phosphatase/kinase
MAAKGRKYRCRAIIMDCEIGMAQHNNTFREIIGTDAKHVGINTMVLRMFYSAYREPTLNEGFDDIIRCNFVPQFESEETEKIYYYTLNE